MHEKETKWLSLEETLKLLAGWCNLEGVQATETSMAAKNLCAGFEAAIYRNRNGEKKHYSKPAMLGNA